MRTILDSAAELLEEVGYVNLTTNAIASRANTSIGSLYQFFPNKDAVIAALVGEYREAIRAFISSSVSVDQARRDIVEFVAVVVDGMERIRRHCPGFTAVFSFRRSGGVADDQRIQLEHDIIEPLSDILAVAYPGVPAAQRDRSMRIVTETTKVLMGRAATEGEDVQEWMRAELKRMLALYLAQQFSHD